jgi:hypothetical protein
MAEMRGISGDRTSLRRIGAIADGFIEANGSEFTTRALEVSSGYLPDHRKSPAGLPHSVAKQDYIMTLR